MNRIIEDLYEDMLNGVRLCPQTAEAVRPLDAELARKVDAVGAAAEAVVSYIEDRIGGSNERG